MEDFVHEAIRALDVRMVIEANTPEYMAREARHVDRLWFVREGLQHSVPRRNLQASTRIPFDRSTVIPVQLKQHCLAAKSHESRAFTKPDRTNRTY